MANLLSKNTGVVFKHVYASYKAVPSVWLGFFSKLIVNITSKCLLAVFFANIVYSVVENNINTLNLLILCTFFLLFITAAINSIGDHYFVKQTDTRYKILAGEFHSRLLDKDVSFFSNKGIGNIGTLFRDHLDGTIRVIRLLRGDVFSFISSLFFPVIALLFYNTLLATVVFIIGLIQMIVTIRTANKVKSLRQDALIVYKKLSQEVHDQLLNISVIKASGREMFFKDSVINLAAEEEALFTSRHKSEAIAELITSIMIALGICFTIWLATRQNTIEKENIKTIVVTILYLLQINLAISGSPDLFKSFNEHIDRVYATLPLLSNKWESSNRYEVKADIIKSPDIVFDNVNYSYQDESGNIYTQVFKNFNLEIKAGSHCAIMGKSGIGKSTLANLIMRFYNLTGGNILIDQINIYNYNLKYYRESISYVPSQPILFNKSIRDNLILYSPNASEEEIIAACMCAQAHEFISKLRHGYDSLVQERGNSLSSGQKQRIAIARALLRKEAKIFIFDEITSALDEDAADSLVTSIRERLSSKTVLFMTHNVELAQKMDYTVML